LLTARASEETTTVLFDIVARHDSGTAPRHEERREEDGLEVDAIDINIYIYIDINTEPVNCINFEDSHNDGGELIAVSFRRT